LKRIGLYLSVVLIFIMGVLPLYTLEESLGIGKIPDTVKRLHWNNNNTSRVWAGDWKELQKSVLSINDFSKENPPELVVLVEENSWTDALIGTSLLASPMKAAFVMVKDNLESILEYLNLLKPTGTEEFNGVQAIIIGRLSHLSNEIRQQGFSVLDTSGDSTLAAEKIDEIKGETFGYSREVFLFDIRGEEGESLTSLPASSWAVHKGTPFLFLEKGEIPEATRRSLKKRKNDLSIYILTAPGQIESSVLNDLKSFGKVLEIGDSDPTENSLKFAQFYDPDKNLGWRALDTREGGKNYLLAPAGDWHFALSGVQLFSRGVFGPLLVIPEENKVPPALEKFYFQTSPNWWVTPAEGPYNHTWIIGDTKRISYPVQGRLNFLQEISSYDDLGSQGVSGLEALTIVWYALSCAGAILVWFHLTTRMFQLSPFMKFAWVLVVLSLGPVGLWAYFKSYRGYAHQVATGEFIRPLWVQVLTATCSTMGFGIPVMVGTAFILAFFGLPLFFSRGPLFGLGSPMSQSVIWSYLTALFTNGLIFVPLMLAFKEKSGYWNTVRANWLTVVISMTAISIGMMTSMWWFMMEYLEMMPEEENLLWWGSMYAASLVGLATGYLGNWVLVIRGEKKGTM